MSRGKTIPEITEEEEQKIREEFDKILVRSSEWSGKQIHLPDGEGSTLCSTEEGVEYNEKTFAMYPPGYRSICRHCAGHWRQ